MIKWLSKLSQPKLYAVGVRGGIKGWISAGVITLAIGVGVWQAGTSDTVAPTVSLTAPAAGATISGTTAVSATASDNVAVTQVDFYHGGTNLIGTDSSSPYSINWDTTSVANAGYTLTAKASDAGGNTTTSSGVTVTVSNGGASPGTANLWIDSTGGTCSRQTTAGAYVDAQACSSLQAAYTAASCSDTVLIKGGSYNTGSTVPINGTKSCTNTWTVGATHGATCSTCIDFKVAPSESVNLGRLDIDASYFIVEKGTGTALNINGSDICTGTTLPPGQYGPGITNIMIRDANYTDDYYVNCATKGPFNNVALIGGSLGGFSLGQAFNRLLGIYLNTCYGGRNNSANDPNCENNYVGTFGTNFLIDGVYFHDMTTPNWPGVDDHTGVFRVDGGYDGVTIRNNVVGSNVSVTTSPFQPTNVNFGGIDPKNITFQNNIFGPSGPGGRAINFNSALVNCTNYKILYNTSTADPLYLFGCTNETGTVTAGNVAPWAAGADCMGTHVKNFWSGSSSGCGSDQFTTGSLGLGGTNNAVPQAGSPVIRAGETVYCPAADQVGNFRPNPAATNCDAGAIESGS